LEGRLKKGLFPCFASFRFLIFNYLGCRDLRVQHSFYRIHGIECLNSFIGDNLIWLEIEKRREISRLFFAHHNECLIEIF